MQMLNKLALNILYQTTSRWFSSGIISVEESFQSYLVLPLRSLNVLGQASYVPSNTVPTISCSGINNNKTILEDSVLVKRKEYLVRGVDDASNKSSDSSTDDDSDDDNDSRSVVSSSLLSHHSHKSDFQHKLLTTAVNTSLMPPAGHIHKRNT